MGEKSKLRRTISKWANSTDMHARDMRATYVGDGDVSIADAADRALVTPAGHPALADACARAAACRPSRPSCSTAPASSRIVWLGRRRIAGIDPGRSMRVQGRIGVHDGVRVIYNPRYELIS